MKTKYVISICIFVILISMTCISASENVNQTDSLGLSIEDNVETAENDIGITSQIYGEVELKENENKSMNSDILGVSNEDEILGAKDIYVTGNTFKDIQNAISKAGKGDIIHLNGTYKNNNHGNIKIESNEISIIGTDNATLDAEGYSRIFYVSKTSTVTKINIQNITFINGKAYEGGAIYFDNYISNSIINATFINNTAEESGGANFFKYEVSNLKIGGTFINNEAVGDKGGANYFESTVSKSSAIAGTYTNNTAKYGGANFFDLTVSDSTVAGTYANNTARSSRGGGGANYFRRVSSSTVAGTYTNNKAEGDGGANYFLSQDAQLLDSTFTGTYTNNTAKNGGANYFHSVSGSTVAGTYTNNKAVANGGANHFGSSLSGSNVTGTYINNTASDGVVRFAYFQSEMVQANVINAIFLNNSCGDEISAWVSQGDVVVNDCWFGNNASNFKNKPHTSNVQMKNWLFLNATADHNSLSVMDSTNIAFKLNSTDGTNVFGFDNSKFPIVNLTLTAARGDVEKTTTLDKAVKYVATERGKGSVTASIENAEYSIFLDNVGLDPEFSVNVNPQEIDYGNNTKIFLSYNGAAEGTVNITLTGKKHTQKIENIDLNKTIGLSNTILPDEYEVTVTYSGDTVFANASATSTLTVNQLKSDIKVVGHDIYVNETRGLMFNVTLPENATGNLTISNGTILDVTKEGRKENNSLVIDIMNNAHPIGKYEWTFTYSGDDIYESSKETSVTNILITPTEITANATSKLFVDDTARISYNLTPDGAVGDIVFTSNDTSVVEVDQNGNIKAIAEGTALITVTFEGSENYTASSTNITITVSKIPTEINITNETVELKALQNISGLATLNPARAGNLTYTSSDENIVRVSDDGIIYARIKGTATITVSFTGNNKYKAAENKTINVSVTLNDARVSVNNGTLNLFVDDSFTIVATTVPEGLNVTYMPDNSGVYSVDENGLVTALKEGTAMIIVKVGGDGVYALNSTTVSVTVNEKPMPPKENLTIRASANPITVGDNATVVVTGLENATGNVSVRAGDGIYFAPIVNGIATLIISGLRETTNGQVSYPGDEKYNNASTTVTIVVNPAPEPDKKNLTIKASADAITVGENATVTVTGLENATGNVSVIVNGKTYTAPINNGEAKIIVPDLTESVTASVNYVGDKTYNAASTTVNITVIPKSDVVIVAENVTKYYHGPERFIANIYDSELNPIANKTVSITINRITYTRNTDENGTVSLAINLGSGTYTVITQVDSTSVKSYITVLSTIAGNDITKYYRNATQYSVQVFDTTGKVVGKGEVVTFNINGRFYNRTTDENGIATLNINLPQGEYVITAINKVTGELHSNNIVVLPVVVAENLTMKYLDGSQFKANLVDGQGKPYAEQFVTLNVNGILYNRLTDSNGQAALNIRLPPGEYIITSSFNGCNVVNKITITG